ncbi:MAG: EAL domain-containing protein [Dehalococcoidia bacterium]|nr:EAL domain-containing protein [Dehalococcoidia bacterium]
MHPLLQRQLKRFGIDEGALPAAGDPWAQLLERISRSYLEADQDRYLLERSLAISSQEMQELYERLDGEKRSLEALSAETGHALLNTSSDMALLLDVEGRILDINNVGTQLLRLSAHASGVPHTRDLVGASLFDLMSPEVAGVARDRHAEVVSSGRAIRFEELVDDRWLDSSIYPVMDSAGSVVRVVALTRDITDRKTSEEELRKQAFHDTLTGLPNRALFLDRLEQALASLGRSGLAVAVLFMDVDRFKTVNDRFGHPVGDELLIAIGRRLLSSLRPGDTVARLGGDEFAVLVECASNPNHPLVVADRIADALAAPFELGNQVVHAAASIGVAIVTANNLEDVTPSGVVRDADIAMYRAKADPLARYVIFDKEMNARSLERLELKAALRAAVEAGQIGVHYQPAVEFKTGRVIGVEALARWHHPGRGPVAPSEFIPLAEEIGLIGAIGRHVVEQGCRQVLAWDAQFPAHARLTLGVNIAPSQLLSTGFVDEIDQILVATDFPAGRLRLEIAESVALLDIDLVSRELARLRALGVSLAIDDFGTSQTSLKDLPRLMADTLKIGRGFVAALDGDDAEASVVEALIALARNFDMEVTATGVETAQVLDRLLRLGCERGQGFYFAPAMSPEALGLLFATGDAVLSPGAALARRPELAFGAN